MADNLVILDFLTNDAGIDVMAAAKLVTRFQELGFSTGNCLWALTQEDIKKIVDDTAHRRKIQAAVRRGPNHVKKSPRRKKMKISEESISDEPACLPPDELPEDQLHGDYKVNRSPVMILWSAVVAYSTKYTWDEALSLGSTVSALNAQSKAASIWDQPHQKKSQGLSDFFIDGPQVYALSHNVPELILVYDRNRSDLADLCMYKRVRPESGRRYRPAWQASARLQDFRGSPRLP